jgi:uncharacterized protein YcfJ
MNFKELYFHTAVIACSAGFLLGLSGVAQASEKNAMGIVEHHYKTVINQTPYKVEVCRDVQVPYGSKKELDTEGAIVGGIIGGIIGNQIGSGSGKEAATGVGALTGAIIGGSKEGKQGTRIERQCSYETRYKEESKTVYSHSTITFWNDNKEYTLKYNK